MKTLITGITVSGNITLGNYLGMIKRVRKISDEYNTYIFIANLHGLTMPKEKYNKVLFKEESKKIAALYIACGFDGNNSNIFYQSDISEISELNYLLSTNTTIGELSRMTQFKDKSSNLKSKNKTDILPTGLLIYPVLMASDILSLNSDFVLVGQDQKQHIELTRNLAERLNNKFSKPIFNVPEPIIVDGQKIMALHEPTKKMSKSDILEKNTIFLLDNKEAITKKIKSSVTDSENIVKFNRETKPGISNLINIYSLVSEMSIDEIEKKYQQLGYKEFKEDLIEEIINELEPIQEKYNNIVDSDISKIIEQGTKNARKISSKLLKKVKDEMGLNNE